MIQKDFFTFREMPDWIKLLKKTLPLTFIGNLIFEPSKIVAYSAHQN
jgi:hypothetical protein